MSREPGALYELCRRTAQQQPDQPAFTFLDARLEPTSYTYAELFERADQIAAALEAQDIAHNAPLGILLTSQEAQTLHYIAALSVGAVPAILTPPNRKLNRRYYAETMAAVLERSRFAAVVTDVESLELRTPTFAPFSFEPLHPVAAANTTDHSKLEPKPDHLPASFLQFSSGTTGIKRGVLVSDEAVLSQLQAYSTALRLSHEDCILSWLPLYHDMGFIACLNMALAYGVHCVMIDPINWVSNPVSFVKAASDYRATLAWNPNFAYAFMAQRVRDEDSEGLNLSSLRGLVNCSEPVTHESQQQFLERFAAHGLAANVFLGCYAMAETTFALTHGASDDPDYLDEIGPLGVASKGKIHVSVGRPLPGVELRIVTPDGAPLPDREVGEIWVKSPFNFSGYYNDPAATEEAFIDGWYRTGDLGYRVGDAFYVSGRKKDVLIVGGVNVFPQDIEDLVSQVPGVRPGRIAAFSNFDPQAQTEHVTILAESDLQGPEGQRAVLNIRQQVLAAFQIANFEVHLVPPEWMVKSSAGKMARGPSKSKWMENKE